MLFMLRSKWSILLTPVERYADETVELRSSYKLVDALPDADSPWRPMNTASASPRAGADVYRRLHSRSRSIG